MKQYKYKEYGGKWDNKQEYDHKYGGKQDLFIKKSHILGKIIRSQFDQHKITHLLTFNLCSLAIPTINPSP